MRVISLSNASALPYGGTEYLPGDDGVYDVPEPVGVELTTKHASMWRTEAAHRAAANAADIEQLRDPNVLPKVVAELRARVAALEARAQGDAPPAPAPAVPTFAPPAEDDGGAKPTAAKSPATAKKTAPRKAAAPRRPRAAKGAKPDPETGESAPEQSEPEAPAGSDEDGQGDAGGS